MVAQFFQTRQELEGVVHLIDVRHPTAEDQRTRLAAAMASSAPGRCHQSG